MVGPEGFEPSTNGLKVAFQARFGPFRVKKVHTATTDRVRHPTGPETARQA